MKRSLVEKFMCEEVVMEVSVRDGIDLSGQVGYKILKITS
jgi:hypothetical protein